MAQREIGGCCEVLRVERVGRKTSHIAVPCPIVFNDFRIHEMLLK